MTTMDSKDRIGARVDIFQPSPNGQHVLNLPALRTLIDWAEGDQALADLFGTWDQAHWAKALVGGGFTGSQIDQSEVYEQTKNGVCSTAYCMAGQTVVQAGYRLIYDHSGHERGRREYQTGTCVKQEYVGRGKDGKPQFRDTGEVMSISGAAREVLGMDSREADALFDGDNRIDDLKAIINAMCERRGLPIEYHDVDESEFEDDTPDYIEALGRYAVGEVI